MSKPQSKIPSRTRSVGAITPERHRTRRTFSVASPARSDAPVRLSSVVEKFINNDKFTMSPINRRSVLPDDTEIEAPRRASWWKRLEGSSRDVLEALDTNRMPDDLLMDEYEFEVEKDKQNQTVQESSDNESVASIFVPRRNLFNREKQPEATKQSKFGEILGSCKSLGKTNIEDVSIDDAPKNLFNKGPRNKPVFPAALLNSTNKTINKTVEPETIKKTRPNLFGQAGTKRKNVFTDLVLSESEEDSEVQHKVFGFKNKRMSLGTRNRRMPSLTPSMTTEIDIDDWNLLPSSTMIGGPEVSRIITNKDIELAQEENQDLTLTEENLSLNPETDLVSKTKSIQNRSLHQTKQNSLIQNEDNDKTLTNEYIETDDPSKHQDVIRSKSVVVEDKTLQNKSSKRNNNDEEVVENIAVDQELDNMLRPLVEYEPSVEEAMAELHREIMGNDTSRRNSQSITQNRASYTNTPGKDKSGKIESSPVVQESPVEEEIEPSTEEQEVEDISKEVTQENEDEYMEDVSEKDKSEEEIEPSTEEQEVEDSSKEVTQENEDGDIEDVSEKDKSEEEIEPSTKEQEVEDSSKEVTQENEDEDMEDVSEKDKSEEEIEPSTKEQEVEDSSKEVTQENEDEDMEDVSEKDKSEEEIEPSVEEQEDKESSKEASQEHRDEDIDNLLEKDRETGQEVEEDQESHNSSKEESHENQDDDMEEMVWDDNDDEKSSGHVETEVKGKPGQEKSRKVSMASHASLSKNITNKSQKTGLSIREDQVEQENDVIEETPNNSTHDTTDWNRKKELSQVKSPEAVLQNITKDNESFRPIGRSTTFRKSKSVIFDNVNVRTSLPPVQESTLGSEGSRNSSTEGSEWDSHRTTRKTIRQTFGRGFTPRKSLRALVMEQSAKRQTEHYNKTTANMTKNKSVVDDVNEKNASRINKTKNKTVVDDVTDRDASKMNKTKNKTVVDDVTDRDASKMNKTKNKTVVDDVTDRDASKMNKTKNKTVVDDVTDRDASKISKTKNKTFTEDVNERNAATIQKTKTKTDQHSRVSNRNISSDQLSASKSLVHETFTHHVSDSLTSERQVSYHLSLQDINEPEISEQQIYNHDASINISEQANNDSGPEISIHASYGQSMSAEHSELENLENAPSDLEISDKENRSKKEISLRDASVPKKSMHVTSEQEILDYEASDNEQSEEESEHDVEEHSSQENAEQDISVQELSKQSAQEEEKEDSGPEESENEVESEESENEEQMEHESQEKPESEQEESLQEIDAESEKESENDDHDMSQESVKDVSQHESDQESVRDTAEEPEQEVSDQDEESQQEIEAESEHESENEDHDMSEESVNDVSQHESDQESVRDTAEEPEQEVSSDEEENDHEDSDHFVSGLNSPHQMSNSNRTDRVVFDNEMSDQEIDYERSDRVSRQMTDKDISEQVSEREPTPDATTSRISEHSRTHDVSVESKSAILLMQLEKIAQKNAEIRQQIAKKVENSLKPTRNLNFNQSPIKYKFSNRRINIPEPKKPKRMPKPTGFSIPIEALPKQFVEDLKYKPPKRFSPGNAPWITKRLYKYLETKLEPKYDYRARVRAEELVQNIYSFAKLVKRRNVAPQAAVDELKREMARLHIVNTHHEFYCFFHEFMPREIRIKVNPDVVNKIPMPRNGIFGEILQSRATVE